MIIKLLTEQQLEFLSLKGGCTGSSESTLVKMPHCWKSHVTSQLQPQNQKLGMTVKVSKTQEQNCGEGIFEDKLRTHTGEN